MTTDTRPARTAGTSTDTTPLQVTTPHGSQVNLDGSLGDDTLRAWRGAATTGGLPQPNRRRWQQLRAGVVNMWEFDVAEYWSADGRAQFVGRNEQGKSTMMTMTTLTMLTGDLSPRYVDTFGESHRTFRYYLEPTEDPKDRRPTKEQLNRGWTWVEYGRLTDAGAEYFTTLLFVQARRTSSEMPKSWVTHRGPERVRAGLTLVREQAAVPAADLPDLPGLTKHPRASDYTRTVASVLFGFSDQQRLRTVVELLKTLRTPKLGNRLNPDWVVERIREALPPLAAGEINELAEGWDQLGQIAKDRDSAREAQASVTAYLRSAWNPWADAMLRRAADDLASAVTTYDDVTRDATAATTDADAARAALNEAKAARTALELKIEQTQNRRTTLLESQEYRAAANAGRQVTELRAALERAAADERTLLRSAASAAANAKKATSDLEVLTGEVSEAERELLNQVERVGAAGTAAGIADAAEWAQAHDTSRLLTAASHRLGHIKAARELVRKLGVATTKHERSTARLQDAESREQSRQHDFDFAETARETTEQSLSDALEQWAATLTANPGATPPPGAVRESWLDSVLDAADGSRPTQVLSGLVRDEWLTPAVEPLRYQATRADLARVQASGRAAEANALADQAGAEHVPVPADPPLWQRRSRPGPGPLGAPLWQLLDPLPSLALAQLGALEAALAGAGLLDSWVTPDGVWSSDRDGADQVLTLHQPQPGSGAMTLRSVLTVADQARGDGPLSALETSADSLLDLIGWASDAHVTPSAGLVMSVGADGSWATPTTSGRAIAPAEGASLLGASARQSARQRRIAELRQQAETERAAAARHAGEAEQHRARVAELTVLARLAPDDAALVNAVRHVSTSAKELTSASRDREVRQREADDDQATCDRENAALVSFTAEHSLVVSRLGDTEAAVQEVRVQAEKLASSIRQRRSVIRNLENQQQLAARLVATDQAAQTEASDATLRRAAADSALATATAALGATDQELLADANQLITAIRTLESQRKDAADRVERSSAQLGRAEAVLAAVQSRRSEAETNRSDKLNAWWVPLDAGLAVARGYKVDEARTLTAARNQARQFRGTLRPRQWPDAPGPSADKERDQVLNRLRDRVSGAALIELNNTLNRTGGRTATVEHDDQTGLPQVQVRVDSSGTTVGPVDAERALEAKAAELGEIHDQQMHEVMQQLLSSTFVEHLRNQVKGTERLIGAVNQVLGRHPTGTTKTVLRLYRKAAPGHQVGYAVLQRLLTDGIDTPAVQQQIQDFLTGQIRAAQDEGQASGRDWKELLGDKLDYRNWFSVVTQWRVLTSAKSGGTQQWQELTTQRHGQDSGGGKVMTMLQPLLATLATLYQASPTAPRPLWLDEAFDGVDGENTTSLLGMLVEFDFDFLLAGPKAVVASHHVPCAAVWMVNRAPAPLPGVDLGLWLYAAGDRERIEMAEHAWADPDSVSGAPDGAGTTAVEVDDEQGELWS